MEFLMADASNI